MLMIVGYVVGAVPTAMFLDRMGLRTPFTQQIFELFYAPLILIDAYIPWCHELFQKEQHFLKWLSGR